MSAKHNWSDLMARDKSRALAAANQLLPAWVSLVIVILIGWQLAKVIWLLIPTPAASSAIVVPTTGAVSATKGASFTNTEIIANAHIFGEADKVSEAPVVTEQLEQLEETSIRELKLRGTIASDRPEFSIAIIANNSNDEKIYVIDDPVASGVTLHAVYADRVVLNEHGALTNLSLPREFSEDSAANYTRSQPVQRAAQNQASIQAVVAQNVSRLADVIRPTPYFVNGEQQGYRVYPGRDRAQFAALGLRPGDLIKDIDGQSLSDPTQAMQIFQSLGTASQVSVTVERDGTPETIILKTDQLDLGDETTQ